MRVLKYELRPGVTWLQLPAGAEPLHVAGQTDTIQLWCRVDEQAVTTPTRGFLALMTGEGYPASGVGRYVGTAHLSPDYVGFGPNGIVVHVFEYEAP